jgi:hypothetical protein
MLIVLQSAIYSYFTTAGTVGVFEGVQSNQKFLGQNVWRRIYSTATKKHHR